MYCDNENPPRAHRTLSSALEEMVSALFEGAKRDVTDPTLAKVWSHVWLPTVHAVDTKVAAVLEDPIMLRINDDP